MKTFSMICKSLVNLEPLLKGQLNSLGFSPAQSDTLQPSSAGVAFTHRIDRECALLLPVKGEHRLGQVLRHRNFIEANKKAEQEEQLPKKWSRAQKDTQRLPYFCRLPFTEAPVVSQSGWSHAPSCWPV